MKPDFVAAMRCGRSLTASTSHLQTAWLRQWTQRTNCKCTWQR